MTSTGADSIISGEATGDSFGQSVAAGDVNGDGYADVVAGAAGVSSGTGRAYVFHSAGNAGITATTAVAGAGGPNATLHGQTAMSRLGRAVAVGDVNGDGYGDVIIGADYYSTGIGRVYVLHSQGNDGVTLNGIAVGVEEEAESIITGDAAGFYFGRSVAVGDTNGDGYGDVVAGASYGGSGIGKAYVFHSRGNTGVTADATPVGAAAEAESTITGDYSFGLSVIVGDVNGDGYGDLIVGVPNFNPGSAGYAGRAYVFHSAGADGVTIEAAGSASSMVTGGAENDQLGFSVGAGDVNGDGYADVIVGALGVDYPNYTGRAYVLHSAGAAGVASGGAGSASRIITGEGASNYFGASVTEGGGYWD